jgi:hypothetical protein
VRLARTASIADTVTATWNKDATIKVGVRFRLWCASEGDREQLFEAAQAFLDRECDRAGGITGLMHDYVDVGPDAEMEYLELSFHDLAEHLGVRTWDDTSLSLFLDKTLRDAYADQKRKGRR